MEKSPIASPFPSEKRPQTSKKLPTPQEIISHYESQGLSASEASLKAIEDFQELLLRAVGSGTGRKERFGGDLSRKLENVNTRLAVMDMKLDSKPGYSEGLAIGVASGLAVRGIGSVVPHVFGALGQIWAAARSSTTTRL